MLWNISNNDKKINNIFHVLFKLDTHSNSKLPIFGITTLDFNYSLLTEIDRYDTYNSHVHTERHFWQTRRLDGTNFAIPIA